MDYTEIGFVIKPHGLKGSLLIGSHASFELDMLEMSSVFLEMNGSYVPYQVESLAAMNKGKFKLTLRGVESIKDAEVLKARKLFQHKSKLNFIVDDPLEGYEVQTKKGQRIGVVSQLREDQLQPLLIVDRDGEELLIPWVKEFIVEVDEEGRRIVLELPEGLIDL